jgi:hypothetical protein
MCLREKIGPDPRNFNQRVSLGRNDPLIRTFPKSSLTHQRQLSDKQLAVAARILGIH